MDASYLSSPLWRYDVFPSYRGPDVRRSFLCHLLDEFERKGVEIFKDSEIKKGESISPELVKGIRESRICIIILSKKYASSSWCLDELVEIMECRKTTGKIVMTVFYEVDPAHVRKQSGEFGKAFKKTCRKKTEEDKERWKQALTDVSTILGEHSQNWKNEASLVSNIAKDISNKLNMTTSRDFDNLVGIEAHIAKMKKLLCLESHQTRMVGIWGPVGIGKTTIARAIFNQISRHFQRSLFMENVKGKYERNGFDIYSSMLRLQEHFLSEILEDKYMKISHLGTAAERLKYQKVLVVLDDVDKLEQLQALAKRRHWFGKGSIIIVTTEDKHLLDAHEIHHIYEVKFPSREQALEIFSQSAFTQKVPPEGYSGLADEVTELTSHLPLGLCVLGNALRGKCVSGWIDELPRIKTSLNGDIEKVLTVGYNGLHDKDKAIFLHIACLFEGERVDSVKQFLGNSGLEIEHGLSVLVKKSLISIESDKVAMHSLLRQMGREIVRRHYSRMPRRWWFVIGACNIYEVIADNTGTGPVLVILLDTSQINVASERALSGMHYLQFRRFYGSLIDKGSKLEKLWNGIRVLIFLRLLVYVLSMIRVLKLGFFSIMRMSPPAFANIPFGISRR